MKDKPKKLSKSALNKKFIEGLGNRVESHSELSDFPLLVDLVAPYPLRLRVYLFNCTNPPGGRPVDEYKFQVILPGQRPKQRASLDLSDGRTAIIAAYINDETDGFFAIWDADKHDEFSYSANMQVKSDIIFDAMCSRVAEARRHNGEIVVASKTENLFYAIRRRMEIMREEILRDGDIG